MAKSIRSKAQKKNRRALRERVYESHVNQRLMRLSQIMQIDSNTERIPLPQGELISAVDIKQLAKNRKKRGQPKEAHPYGLSRKEMSF